jgi:hypothetical protein
MTDTEVVPQVYLTVLEFFKKRFATVHKIIALAGLLMATLSSSPATAQLQGDEEAVSLVRRMLQTLGAQEVWQQGRTINIQLRGHYAKEQEPWVETFWIDLEEPRGRYEIKSQSSERVIAWTAAGGWEFKDGKLEPYSEARFDLEKKYWAREPNVIFHRLAKGVPATRVVLDTTDANLQRITVIDAVKSDTLCWLAVNLKSEPVKWSTIINNDTFEHVFGPLADFGGIRLPKWGATIGAVWRYEHVTASLSSEPPQVSFRPPVEH